MKQNNTNDELPLTGLVQYNGPILSRGRYGSADVLLATVNGESLALKDYSNRGVFFRWLGILLTKHEAKVYSRLGDLPFVPKCLGKPNRYALILEYIEGKKLSECKAGDLPDDFFTELEVAIERIHAQGVAIRDLNSHNIIAPSLSKPCIVDFATAILKRGKYNFVKNLLFRRGCRNDLFSVAKIKQKWAPRLLAEEDRKRLKKRILGEKCRKKLESFARTLITKHLNNGAKSSEEDFPIFIHSPVHVTLSHLSDALQRQGYSIEKSNAVEGWLETGWKVMDWRFRWEVTPLLLGGSKIRIKLKGNIVDAGTCSKSKIIMVPIVEFSIGGHRWQPLLISKETALVNYLRDLVRL